LCGDKTTTNTKNQRASWLRRGPSTYWPTLGRESWTGTPWGGCELGSGLVLGYTTLSVRVLANIKYNDNTYNGTVDTTLVHYHITPAGRNGCAYCAKTMMMMCQQFPRPWHVSQVSVVVFLSWRIFRDLCPPNS